MDFSRPLKPVAIVTGASRGLGKQIALALGRTGHCVLVNYIHCRDQAEDVVRQIQGSGGEASCWRADVRSKQDVNALLKEAVRLWGAVDIVINNAGINRDGLHVRMSEQDWDSVVGTNLTGAFHVIQSASRLMMKQCHGHIINIASITGIQGREGQANYASSKAGLIGLTKAAARELGRSGIQVNAVLPGFIMTDMADSISKDLQERLLREHCLGRTAEAGEVANFISHLAAMKNVSGQIFNLDSRIL